MLKRFLSSFWHKTLQRPYRLAVEVHEGKGQPVVFLHGIANDYSSWRETAELLPREEYRVIIPDLLGHGSSPKPDANSYTANEHARQIVAMITRLGVDRPVILVGHSMGALIAIEVAMQRPELVRSLILCGTPIYETGKKWRVSSRTNAYFSLYRLLINRPQFTLKSSALVMKLLTERVNFSLTRETWHSFKSSLENTIINQTAYADIQSLTMPVLLIRGKMDMLAPLRPLATLAKTMPNVTLLQINQAHEITKKYAAVIAKEIMTY